MTVRVSDRHLALVRHLVPCLTCGHVGCCDPSPDRHDRAHAFAARHPIVQSFAPGESWPWCYLDETYV